MVRVCGVDPGTRSMDLCGIEDGKVYYEASLDNTEIVKDMEIIIQAIRKAFPLDLIAGPSGMGVELTLIEEIPEEIFEDWYYNYILLSSREDVLKGVKEGILGAMLYKNMADFCSKLKEKRLPVVFIPGVINLPTVPSWRKVNKTDLGTADKMAVTVLGVYDQPSRFGIPYSEVSFILVEVGFGFNAVIGVEGGRIADGIGGTIFPNIGFLTASALDLHLVQLVHNWEQKDEFLGGVASIIESMDPEEFVKMRTEKSRIAFDAMIEGIEKAVASMKVSIKEPKEILLSGRLTKIKEIKEELIKRLSGYTKVRELGFLEGAKSTKETAQGYALIAEGLQGGKFGPLVDWMKIKEAKGTCYDYIYHPRFKEIKDKLVPFKSAKNLAVLEE
jgi:predicted butyrate kinase (DUF1464 family)